MGKKRTIQRNPEGTFCQLCYRNDRPINDEDVVPSWLRTEELRSWTELQRLYGPLPTPSRVLLGICVDHNTKLARLLENEVAPFGKRMLRGEVTQLDPAQQNLWRAWALKTEFLMDIFALNQFARGYVNSTRGRTNRQRLTSEVLNLIAREGAPRDEWIVRLGYSTERGIGDHTPGLASAGFIPSGFEAFVHESTVTSWGHLVMETVVLPTRDAHRFLDAVEEDPRFVTLSSRLSKPVEWPPPQDLTANDILRLRGEWGHGVMAGWSLEDPQEARRSAQRLPTVVVIGDNPELAALLIDKIAANPESVRRWVEPR
jgi:hypothetical protein